MGDIGVKPLLILCFLSGWLDLVLEVVFFSLYPFLQVEAIWGFLIEEVLGFHDREETQDCVDAGHNDDVDAFVVELGLFLGVAEGNRSGKNGATTVEQTEEGENIDDSEFGNRVQLGCEHAESE